MATMRFAKTISIVIVALGFSSVVVAQELGLSEVVIPRGEYALRGQFFEAKGTARAPVVLLLPGIPGTPGDVLGLGQNLAEVGIHVLTFNYSGTHGSGGEWTLANDQDDVQSAFHYLRSGDVVKRYNIDSDRLYLGGYSHGGGVALLFAADHPEVRQVFSIAGNDFGEWARRTSRDSVFAEAIAGAFAHYSAQGWVRPAAGADRELPDNVDKYDVRARAPLIADRELFLAAGLNDRTTALEDHMLPLYRELQSEGATQVRFVVYQADHSFADARDQIARDLIDWVLLND